MKFPVHLGVKLTPGQKQALAELSEWEERQPSDIIRRLIVKEHQRWLLEREHEADDDLPPDAA